MQFAFGPSQAIHRSHHYKWWAYFAVAIGLFSTVMDQSGINIALPEIAHHFDVDIPTVQWITLSYILSTAAMFLPIGRLSDTVGRRRLYLIGTIIFISAAALGGTAQIFPMVIVAKVIQGVGAAGIQANSMAMIADVFPHQERGKALGLYSSIIGTGLITGPIIGGLLVSGLGWRAVFFANMPVGIIALAFALAALPPDERREGPGLRGIKFDWMGAGLSSAALISFLLGMSNGHRWGWDSAPILTSLAAGGVLFVVFVWWESRVDEPMLDMGLFRSRLFSMGVSARSALFLGNASIFFLLPFYLIRVLDFEANIAGLLMVPSAVCMALFGPISGRLSDKIGTRFPTVLGLTISAAGMFTISQLTPNSTPIHVIIGLLLTGTGMGVFSSPNTSAIMSSQSREKYGFISAFLNLARTSSNVVGIALATTIITVTMAALGYEPSLSAVAEDGGEEVRTAFVNGFNKAFLASGSLILVGLVLSGLNAQSKAGRVPAPKPPEQTVPEPAAARRENG